jgi:hypothetical protein
MELVLEKLTSGSRGMFLWASLMLDDLMAQNSVEGVKAILASLPNGLEGAYIQTLERLDRNLTPGYKELCFRVLRWVVCAFRPLGVEELDELLAVETKDVSDPAFLHSRYIEVACGALITIRGSRIHLTHLSTYEFLTNDPTSFGVNPEIAKYFIDLPKAMGECAVSCLQYLSQERFAKPFNPGRYSYRNNFKANDLRREFSPYEYCATYWPNHFSESTFVESQLSAITSFATSKQALAWMEAVLVLSESKTAARALESFAYSLQNKLFDLPVSGPQISLLKLWKDRILQMVQEYFIPLCRWPNELHFVDPNQIFHGVWNTPTEASHPTRVSILGSGREGKAYKPPPSSSSIIKLGFENWDENQVRGYLHINRDRTLAFCINPLGDGVGPTLECQNLSNGQRATYVLDDGLVDPALDTPTVRFRHKPKWAGIDGNWAPYTREIVAAGFSSDSQKFWLVYFDRTRVAAARCSVWHLELGRLFEMRTSTACRKRFAGWLVDDSGESFMPAFPGAQTWFPRIAMFSGEMFLSPFGKFDMESSQLSRWSVFKADDSKIPVEVDNSQELQHWTSKTVFTGNGQRVCIFTMDATDEPKVWVADLQTGKMVYCSSLRGLEGVASSTSAPICGESGKTVLI